jgi:hypothetical protein
MKLRKRVKLKTITPKGIINYYCGNEIKFARHTKVIKVRDLQANKIVTLIVRNTYMTFKREVFTEI